MEIKRSGSQPSGKGPAEYFTGTVRVEPLFNPPATSLRRSAAALASTLKPCGSSACDFDGTLGLRRFGLTSRFVCA